ncbi:MAG: hypothetical protein ACRD0W_08140 [Acidimicrobiales bacterium]
MPVYAALKATGINWSDDGRLVLFGQFFTRDDETVVVAGQQAATGMLATWRPGDPELSLLPYQRPAPPPDYPDVFPGILAW